MEPFRDIFQALIAINVDDLILEIRSQPRRNLGITRLDLKLALIAQLVVWQET